MPKIESNPELTNTSGSPDCTVNSNISRHDFLKLGALGAASLLIPPEWVDKEPLDVEHGGLNPEIISGVEVYGLRDKIATKKDLLGLYSSLDSEFANKKNITIGNKLEQRKALLDPDKRYLEVAVRQSAYDSFLERQDETGVDFVDWIKMNVDAMNRCFAAAKPSLNAETVLRRIVVIDDDMPREFWNEADSSSLGSALDSVWLNRFVKNFPLDTDMSWAIAFDYRANTKENILQGSFFSVREEEGKTILGHPPGGDEYVQSYEFPEKEDSLKGKDGVWIDFGLIHEWSHYVWNLPDEYAQDVHDSKQRFQHFIFNTGAFQKPFFSPFLSILATDHISKKLRNANMAPDSRLTDFSVRPGNINVEVSLETNKIDSLDISRVRLQGGSFYGQKFFPHKPDQVSDGKNIELGNKLFEGDSNCWLLKANFAGGSVAQIHIPSAAFIMSKMSGVDSANYEIEIVGRDDPKKRTQTVELVDDSDIKSFLKDKGDKGAHPYAKMKVDGTNTWFVWFLSN